MNKTLRNVLEVLAFIAVVSLIWMAVPAQAQAAVGDTLVFTPTEKGVH